MMYTLTHDPVVLAVAITPVLIVATALIVGAALWIRSTVLRRATNRIDEAIDAAAALTEPDPTPRETQFATDVVCWLADSSYPAPPVVPGREAA